MKSDFLLEKIHAEAFRIGRNIEGAKWYLFGSSVDPDKLASDIDLLVVCRSSDDVALVRSELRELCSRLPLHLFLVTYEEEAELQFRKGIKSIGVFPNSDESRCP